VADKTDPNATLGGVANTTQIQVEVDDEGVPVTYGKLVRVGASAEEITLDIAGPLKQTSQNHAVMKVENRIILNPWAAKRLAMALGQTVSKYEEMYGPLEIDERKRMKQQ